MHAGAEQHSGQTTGSWVTELRGRSAVHWVTASAAPCISIYKPVLVDVPLPPLGPAPTDRFDRNALWWRHEQLHRAAVWRDLPKFIEEIYSERDALEASFRARVKAVMEDGGHFAERSRLIEQCWQEANETEARWLARLGAIEPSVNDSGYRAAWSAMNELADFDFRR
jgi:hypothetical protein